MLFFTDPSATHHDSTVSAFKEAALEGTLKPTLKSEEAEDSDAEGPVHVLRGSTFEEIVINNSKDVLVEFYAPWCGHCKQLAPIYDELGEVFSDEENVVIAKMDSTANEIDIDAVQVKGFPTLYFFKGDDKENPVVYDGGRTKSDFIKYLKKNASNDLSDVDDEDDDDEDDEDDEDDQDDEDDHDEL